MVASFLRFFVPLAMIAASLAGCLGSAPASIASPTAAIKHLGPAVPADFVDPLIPNHDHANAKLHNLAYHMVETAHHPLGGNLAKSSGAHVIEVQNGYLFVGAYGASVDVSGGLYIFDIKADPEHPTLVGQLNLPGALGGDRSMEATLDANFVVLGEEPIDCAGHTNPFAPGMYLIDTRDKTKPLIVDYMPGAVHSVVVHRIKGVDYVVFAGSNNVRMIDTTGPRPVLKNVGSAPMGHDGAMYDDPVLHAPLLYAADGNAVLFIYNMSDPAKPALIGKWTPADKDHYVHAVAVDWIEGHRIIIIESEDWKNTPSPMWVINGDDLTAPELIGNWTNPGQHPANDGKPSTPPGNYGGQLTFSTHNPRIEHGIVYMAHYHGGVWALNVSTMQRAMNPEILGYYLPHNDNGGFKAKSGEGAYPKPNACGFDLTEIPNTFDVEVQNGIVYAADLHTGMYAMKLAPPGPAPGKA